METAATNYPGEYWFKVDELVEFFISKMDKDHEIRDYDEYRKKRGMGPFDLEQMKNQFLNIFNFYMVTIKTVLRKEESISLNISIKT